MNETMILAAKKKTSGLLGGDLNAGYYGVVESADFITGDALASAVGLTAGTSSNSNTQWMKFALDQKTVYIPKRLIRQTVNWQDLYAAGVVYGDGTNGANPVGATRLQNVQVTIGGKTYKVRLMKGANADNVTNALNVSNPSNCQNSDWNRLIYKVSASAPGGTAGNWAVFTDAELDVGQSIRTWCKERDFTNTAGSANYRVCRGFTTMSYYSSAPASSFSTSTGWRPVLELIE